jgi:hypothetical protein
LNELISQALVAPSNSIPDNEVSREYIEDFQKKLGGQFQSLFLYAMELFKA